MGNLLFSPKGRIGPNAFLQGLGLVALLSALIGMVPAFNFALGSVLGYVSIFLLFPIFCLLIKRSHDAGKSGWMSIVWFIIILLIGGILGFFASHAAGGDLLKEMNEFSQSAAEEGDILAVFEIATDYAPRVAQKTAIPSSIASFAGTMIAGFLINLMVKQETHENQFGPVPNA